MWFKVDDRFHAHRKARRVRRTHPHKTRDASPLGLWVLAGSWCGQNLTDGFIPEEMLEEWDDDWEVLADRLVTAGLFTRARHDGEDGYRFHDWLSQNPEAKDGAYGNHKRWHIDRDVVNEECAFCIGGESGAISGRVAPDIGGRVGVPVGGESTTRPDPTRPEETKTLSPAAENTNPSRSDKSSLESDFEDWWQHYPRKTAKGQARKAYRSARKKTDGRTLVAAVERQTAALMAKGAEYCPYPATWLNAERWGDQPQGQPGQPCEVAMPEGTPMEFPEPDDWYDDCPDDDRAKRSAEWQQLEVTPRWRKAMAGDADARRWLWATRGGVPAA